MLSDVSAVCYDTVSRVTRKCGPGSKTLDSSRYSFPYPVPDNSKTLFITCLNKLYSSAFVTRQRVSVSRVCAAADKPTFAAACKSYTRLTHCSSSSSSTTLCIAPTRTNTLNWLATLNDYRLNVYCNLCYNEEELTSSITSVHNAAASRTPSNTRSQLLYALSLCAPDLTVALFGPQTCTACSHVAKVCYPQPESTQFRPFHHIPGRRLLMLFSIDS